VPLSSSNGIRLLGYLGRSTDEQLACILESASTNDSYHALSYVWGNAEPSSLVRILCNGEPVYITINLFDALSQMWRQFPERRIWADALCINQADHGERISQVAKMGDIYRLSQSVMVWWGKDVLNAPHETQIPDSEIEDLFYDFADWAARGETKWRCDRACTPHQTCAQLSAGQFHKDAGRVMGPGRGLLQNQWLQRMWTMQEICVAPRATVHLGSHYLQWEVFLTGLSLYTQIMPRVLAMDTGTWQGIRFTQTFRNKEAHGLTLSSLLDGSQLRIASEPRDRVYALLGLLSPGMYPSLEKVSYHRSVASLYAEVSRLCWDVDNANNMLFRGSRSRDNPTSVPGLPSWSVDWSTSRQYFPYPLVSADRADQWNFHPRWRSSAPSRTSENVADEFKLRVFFAVFSRLLKVPGPGGLHCESFSRCTRTLRKITTKPATLQVRFRTQNIDLETIRLDSEDVSRISEHPIEAIEMLKSIKDHESSRCTCARSNGSMAKVLKAYWPWAKTPMAKAPEASESWGSLLCEVGRAGDWVGVLANMNGHGFKGLVLLRPDSAGCFRPVHCEKGSSMELLDGLQEQVLEYGTGRVEKEYSLEYFLTRLDLV
jgi:hypothetical protein